MTTEEALQMLEDTPDEVIACGLPLERVVEILREWADALEMLEMEE